LGKRRGLATDEGSRKIGEHLSQLRKRRGITQMEMSKLLGVSQPIVSKYESGELRLHAELVVRLAEILRVSADELLGIKGSTAHAPSEGRLWQKFHQVARLPERDQRAVLRIINSFAAIRKAS
jgi:transcriptional regulator with XRE-family HTH domain